MDQDSNRVVATRHIDKRLPTESADALGAVKAFNAVIHESLGEMVGWLDDVCSR